MNKKILVPLAQNDRAEDMTPYFEKVARPGMKVLFLVRYPIGGFIWAKEEYGVRAALKARKLVNYYSWEGNLEKAKRQVASACEALLAKGIDAAVDIYAGSLKKAVRGHARNGDVHLIITKAAMGNWITTLLDGAVSIFRLFKRPTFSPVVNQPARARLMLLGIGISHR